MRRSGSASFLTLSFCALAATAHAQGAIDPALFSSLTWRSIGPVNTSGRIDDFAVGARARTAGRDLRRHGERRRVQEHERRHRRGRRSSTAWTR